MNVKTFVDAYKAKNFMNTKQGVEERIEWIKKELDVKEYVPFMEKRKAAEQVVSQNITEVDGIKKYDSISGYIDLVVTSIKLHTNLTFDDSIEDYDLLAESGLLPHIMAQFQSSHDELGTILKMAISMELENNNTNALVGRFLNKISGVLDGVLEVAKDKFGNFDMRDVFGADIKEEDLTKLIGLLDKIK